MLHFSAFHFLCKRLQTGWSSNCKRVPLTAAEQQVILSVIKRNEQLELAERQRIGKLVERVERIKQRSSYHGPKNCRWGFWNSHEYFESIFIFTRWISLLSQSAFPLSLCGASFGITILLNVTHKQICFDCSLPVCSHCCIDISNSSSTRRWDSAQFICMWKL